MIEYNCPECGGAIASPEFSRTCSTCKNPMAFDGRKYAERNRLKPDYEPEQACGTADDKGEQCIYCGKDSWTCEHFNPEDN